MDENKNKKTRMLKSIHQSWMIWILAFFFVGDLLFLPVHTYQVFAEEAEELPELYAKSAVLMDAKSGRVLAQKDGDTMRPMASTTKIMTCILALEEGDPEALVTASAEAAAQPEVHLSMREGEQFYLKDLLYSLMLESHNDTAVAIAEHMAGSVPEFAKRMNEKAKEIGCTNTHFVTPNGLDGQDEDGVHSISASDLARIMAYCVYQSPKAEDFLKITQTDSHTFSDASGNHSVSCNNHNLFLSMMDGAISGKTGFTGDAGYCYVGALKRDDRIFTVALLACGWPNNKNYKWADTKALMNYGLEHFEYRNVWEQMSIAALPVKNGISNHSFFEEAEVPVVLDTLDSSLVVLLSEREQVTVQTECEESLDAPVKQGETVGSVEYMLNGSPIKKYKLITGEKVEKKTFPYYSGELMDAYFTFERLK